MSKFIQPPIGIIPEWLAIETTDTELNKSRLIQLSSAIQRYLMVYYPVPVGWIEEFNRRSRLYHSELNNHISEPLFPVPKP
jgi:hypothetical protein